MKIPHWTTWPDRAFMYPAGALTGAVLIGITLDDILAASPVVATLALIGLAAWVEVVILLVRQAVRRLRRPAPGAPTGRVPDFVLTYDVNPDTGERGNILWASPASPPLWSQAGPRRAPIRRRLPWLYVRSGFAATLIVAGALSGGVAGALWLTGLGLPRPLLGVTLLACIAASAVPAGVVLGRWLGDRYPLR